jgi:hypothetical protein
MKRALAVLILATVLCTPVLLHAQDKSLGFSVKAGPYLQTGQISLPLGTLEPYLGLDYMGLSMDITVPGISEVVTEETSMDVGASMFIPYAGVKFLLSNTGDTKPYVFGTFFKSFASVKFESGGESLLGDEVEDFIKDLLGFWGLKFGFGAEYAVSDHFSIGGEYGLNMFFMSGELEMALGDPGLEESIKMDVSASLKKTYVAVVLNFYF